MAEIAVGIDVLLHVAGTAVNYLVQAGTLKGAVGNIDAVMGGTMIDYVIASVAETTLMDVFEYNKTKVDDKPEYEQQNA